ncbi:TMhelix containing protein [Vibrio phage 1.020.O._10N.222.48.A2]|uniref:TMhelix containing protein n=1 Tax=Vibrio phage 1.020.O._10N.222.48.A2 TaxID=1881450 RepID=A0A2I7QKX0_9VIRU|nr:antimicrobial peptide resistance and lipid A acylation protein PagP [Vibrio phage 1.020.O._10N.222.48.A2]AUR82046.1 TMhelix containing protein [Vibrio phage 1.020.O._10N.222.48.A2]
MSDFYIYVIVAIAILTCASICAKAGSYGVALVLVHAVCMISPADASENKFKAFMGDAYSFHFNRSFDYNEVHKTYGLEYQITPQWGINTTSFTNSFSERSNSLAVVYTWKRDELLSNVHWSAGVQTGIATGYEKAKYNAGGVAPIVAPFVDVGVFESVGARFSIWNAYVANVSFYLEF